MSARRRVQRGRVRSRREVLAAVGASAAVIVLTAFLVWLIRPSDSSPEITDISETTVPSIGAPTETGVPATTAPALPSTAPASTAAPSTQP